MTIRKFVLFAMLGAALPVLGACAAAAGAAVGAAGAIAYNERNAETRLTASVSDIAAATAATFQEMGITETERRPSDGGSEIRIFGDSADGNVTVEIDNEGEFTEVTVTVREGELDYKPTIAGRILERIVARVS